MGYSVFPVWEAKKVKLYLAAGSRPVSLNLGKTLANPLNDSVLPKSESRVASGGRDPGQGVVGRAY
jgi:hypothetical protein